jgi:hypothetical protein
VNLFSINKALKNDFKIGNDGITNHQSKDSTTLSFDRVMETKNEFMSGVRLHMKFIQNAGYVVNRKKADIKFHIKSLNKSDMNCGKEASKLTFKSYNFKLIGRLKLLRKSR